ncbi:MAG: DUF3592 domain-containing protein [Candidatus Sericytochromatia bacterium]
MPTLSEPPRFLPLSIRVRLLWGDFLHQFGWWMLSASLIMILVCLRAPDWEEFNMTPENMQTVTARIISVKPYSSTKYGSGFTYVYRFESQSGGERVEATVFLGGEQRYKQGGTAQVEYLRENPLRSRLPEERSTIWIWVSMSAVGGLLFLALALFSLFCLVISWRDGQYRVRLLQLGRLQTLEEVDFHWPDPQGPAGHVDYRFTPFHAEQKGEVQAVSRCEVLEHSLVRKVSPDGPWHVLYFAEEPEKAQLWELWGHWLKQEASGAFQGHMNYFLYLLTPPVALVLFLLLYFFQDTPASRFF